MVFNQDLKEFISLLNEEKVDYLIVGGYALAIHGVPRYTQDIDFWLRLDEKNIQKVLTVLKRFGFESLNISVSDFLNTDNIIQLGYPPNRIDLLSEIDGVGFEKAFENKAILDIDGISVNFINFHDLLANKKASGRLQDLADLESLEKIKKNRKDKE